MDSATQNPWTKIACYTIRPNKPLIKCSNNTITKNLKDLVEKSKKIYREVITKDLFFFLPKLFFVMTFPGKGTLSARAPLTVKSDDSWMYTTYLYFVCDCFRD